MEKLALDPAVRCPVKGKLLFNAENPRVDKPTKDTPAQRWKRNQSSSCACVVPSCSEAQTQRPGGMNRHVLADTSAVYVQLSLHWCPLGGDLRR